MGEQITNGDFTDGLTGWDFGSGCLPYDWEVAVYDEPPPYGGVTSFASDCITYLSQPVDLTNVNNITFNARGWLWPDMCGPGWLRLTIGSTVVWERLDNIPDWTPQIANVSIFAGTFTIKFSVYSPTCGARLDVKAISAIRIDTPVGLADAPWPKFHHNLKNTGLSTANVVTDGSLKWQYATGGAIYSSPAIDADGTIYVGSDDHYLHAINPDGSLKWKYLTGGALHSSPMIDDNHTIYIGCPDGYLYAIFKNGNFKWRYNAGDIIDASSPTIANDGTIYIGSRAGSLVAINYDGILEWEYPTGGVISSSPAIGDDGTIYVGSYDNHLYAINPDGSLKWKYLLDGDMYSSPAIADDGTIYVGSSYYSLYAINPDGSKKWKHDTGRIYSSPAIDANGTIYIGSNDHYLYGFRPDGSFAYKYLTLDPIDTSSPAINGDGTIYIGSSDSWFYNLFSACTLHWRYNTGNAIASSPAIDSDGTVYIGSLDGYLYAFGPAPSTTTLSPISTYWSCDGTPPAT